MKEIVVHNQEEFDNIKDSFGVVVVIDGGTEESPIKIKGECFQDIIIINKSFVEVYGNNVVFTGGNCKVKAFENSIVKAFENSIVKAFENSKVKVFDKSVVKLYDNAKIIDDYRN